MSTILEDMWNQESYFARMWDNGTHHSDPLVKLLRNNHYAELGDKILHNRYNDQDWSKYIHFNSSDFK